MSDHTGRRGSIAGRLAADTRVLVVEDERDIADFLRAYFRASGYDLVHIDPPSADDVVAAVREQRPDCVLLDVRLRGFSGIDAYRQLRGSREFAFVPIVLVTADSTAATRTTTVAEGIDGYVEKPFSVHALEDMVADRIRRARALREEAAEHAGLATAAQLRAQLADQVRAAALSGGTVSFALIRLNAQAEVGGGGPAAARQSLLEMCEDVLPEGTVVGHAEGEELGAVIVGMAADPAADLMTEVLEESCRDLRLPGGAAVIVDAHAGVADFPEHAATAEQLEMASDAALADAVESGDTVAIAR